MGIALDEDAPGRERFIYAITCLPTGKRYIGQTVEPVVRFATHRNSLRHKRHHCKEMQADWDQYGKGQFLFAVLQSKLFTKRDTCDAEAAHIFQSKDCYNYMIAVDAESGRLTPINRVRLQQSEALKKAWQDPDTLLRTPIRSPWHNPERKRKHSERMTDLYTDPEERRKTAEATKSGQTEEVRKRKSEASIKSWQDPNGRQRTAIREMSEEGKRIKAEKSAAFWSSPEGLAEKAKRRERLKDYWNAKLLAKEG